jgi:hypothetical protein
MSESAAEHLVYHFTHVSHLRDIVHKGLLCDSAIQGTLSHEAGDRQIKDLRRGKRVPCGASGVVADYVPFYFAPRSPMLYRITNPLRRPGGGVATYDSEPHELVYLVSSVELLSRAGCELVLTDRNATVRYAAFSDDPDQWFADGFIDWPLMHATYWNNSPEDPERMERRMAECLVHGRVPWSAVVRIIAHNEDVADWARRALRSAGVPSAKLEVEPGWYF